MKFKSIILAVVLLGGLAMWGAVPTPASASSYQSFERELLPLWVSEPQGLTTLGAAPLVVGGRTIGILIAYDDASTGRAADYLELYDNTGQLIAVSWFDRFGIERVAVDRGLVDQKAGLDGVFVVFLEGEAV